MVKPTIQPGIAVAWMALLGFEALAQIGLKAGGERLADQPFGLHWLLQALSEPWVLAGIIGYLGAFAAWMAILDRVSLSFAFPLTAVIMIVVAAASYFIFGETISWLRGFGIALIIAGVVMIGRSDR